MISLSLSLSLSLCVSVYLIRYSLYTLVYTEYSILYTLYTVTCQYHIPASSAEPRSEVNQQPHVYIFCQAGFNFILPSTEPYLQLYLYLYHILRTAQTWTSL